MKKVATNITFSLLLIVLSFASLKSFSQANPAPFDLNASFYSFTSFLNNSSLLTQPANGRFHVCSTVQPLLATPTNSDYAPAIAGPFNPGNANAQIEGLDGSGIGSGFAFTTKPGSGFSNVGAFVLALNTTRRTNINLTFTWQELSAGAIYKVRLQYRLSKRSAWQDVTTLPGPTVVEFNGTGNLGSATTIGPLNLSTLTSNAVNNRSNLQLRWKYYYVSGPASAFPTRIRIDDITVNSSPSSGNYISVDTLNAPLTGYCVSPTLGASTSLSFRYAPIASFPVGTTFIAQLSDELGSFASPVNIGTLISTTNTGFLSFPNVTIPANTPSGNSYKIRVVTYSPTLALNGASDNVFDVIIKLSPKEVTSFNAECGPASSTLTWALPTDACYDDVMVVTSLSPTVVVPTGDGSAYTANSVYGTFGTAFGAGYVSYKGNGTSVVVTNLTDGFTYYFKVWMRYGTTWTLGQELSCTPDVLTKVVVSSYFNANTANNEWTELLVTGDNVDLRGWALRDNNTDQDNWQPAIVFNNIPLWNHLRRGTVIMIWHRTTGRAIDVNLQDGYIEVEANPGGSNTYFTGGDGSTTLNVSGTGDIIEILSPGLTHVHGLGHLSTAGSSWTSMSIPKLNHALSIADGEAVFACPAANINDYNGPATGNAYTGISNSATTFGLPNCASTNENYWKSLRQPLFTTQTVTISTFTFGTPGSVTFTWNPCIDPYTTDNYVGYLILRNTANNFTLDPSDGKTYGIGSIIGSAEVVGIINNSTTATFTDNTVTNGFAYYYRVYAFRYGTDDKNGDEYNVARGRAFNETNFVSVNWPGSSPLPVDLLAFTGKRVDDKVVLNWITSSEKDNDYFLIEKRNSQGLFDTLGKVKGAINSSAILNYSLDDLNPNQGINYYRLTQFDIDGKSSDPKIAAVNFSSNKSIEFLVSPNPFNSFIDLNCNANGESPLRLEIYDYLGRLVLNKALTLNLGYNHFQLDLNELSKGYYFLKAESSEGSYFQRIIKQ